MTLMFIEKTSWAESDFTCLTVEKFLQLMLLAMKVLRHANLLNRFFSKSISNKLVLVLPISATRASIGRQTIDTRLAEDGAALWTHLNY